ncbi:MAG: selenium metabolism-associated LysR family transcriptional regulator [Syntrophales bacterium]|nr:selenium metabolism-associated LysR family transcriptional regulator [Syntrophales bacterium]
MTLEDFRNISLQQLEALLFLVTEGNFSRAAKKMHLSQPSLSKHIANMEAILGMTVVRREKTGVVLTPEGKIVYDLAARILKLRDDAAEKIAGMQQNEAGDIAVAASTIPATYILPHVLSRFRKVHPGICVTVQSADSEEVLNMILNGEKELGIIGKKPSRGKLEVEPLWQDRLVLTVPAGHRWAGKPSVSLPEVMEEPFIIREKGSATREIIERYLKERTDADAKFRIAAQFGSSESVKEAILAGLGVSILSIRAITRELKLQLLEEVPVEDWRIERYFYLILRRPFNILRHHQLFLDFIRQYQLD